MKDVATVGLDLAKNVFQVHGVDRRGKIILRKTLRRAEVASIFAKLPVCLIGMEACGGAHFWARKLSAFGHTVRLMAPQFVKPYVKANKNDARDAEAICEAVTRPTMRYVPTKSADQQAVLALHRVRQGFVTARTARANQIRGLLGEFGITLRRGIRRIGQELPAILSEENNGLPESSRQLFQRLLAHLRELDRQVHELEVAIHAWHFKNEDSERLEAIPGIGPLTATALVSSIGEAKAFSSGRQLAAWLGLVPRQDSSGGKERLLGISKRGDVYLRTLLIHGARSLLLSLKRRGIVADSWIGRLLQRRGFNVAIVAIANKNARIVWALLAHHRQYRSGYCTLSTEAALA